MLAAHLSYKAYSEVSSVAFRLQLSSVRSRRHPSKQSTNGQRLWSRYPHLSQPSGNVVPHRVWIEADAGSKTFGVSGYSEETDCVRRHSRLDREMKRRLRTAGLSFAPITRTATKALGTIPAMLHSKQLLVGNTDGAIASMSCLIEAPTFKRLMASRSYVCPSALCGYAP